MRLKRKLVRLIRGKFVLMSLRNKCLNIEKENMYSQREEMLVSVDLILLKNVALIVG